MKEKRDNLFRLFMALPLLIIGSTLTWLGVIICGEDAELVVNKNWFRIKK